MGIVSNEFPCPSDPSTMCRTAYDPPADFLTLLGGGGGEVVDLSKVGGPVGGPVPTPSGDAADGAEGGFLQHQVVRSGFPFLLIALAVGALFKGGSK
jgi:hypothetical protein